MMEEWKVGCILFAQIDWDYNSPENVTLSSMVTSLRASNLFLLQPMRFSSSSYVTLFFVKPIVSFVPEMDTPQIIYFLL